MEDTGNGTHLASRDSIGLLTTAPIVFAPVSTWCMVHIKLVSGRMSTWQERHRAVMLRGAATKGVVTATAKIRNLLKERRQPMFHESI